MIFAIIKNLEKTKSFANVKKEAKYFMWVMKEDVWQNLKKVNSELYINWSFFGKVNFILLYPEKMNHNMRKMGNLRFHYVKILTKLVIYRKSKWNICRSNRSQNSLQKTSIFSKTQKINIKEVEITREDNNSLHELVKAHLKVFEVTTNTSHLENNQTFRYFCWSYNTKTLGRRSISMNSSFRIMKNLSKKQNWNLLTKKVDDQWQWFRLLRFAIRW